jgi:hypothetical protein
MSVRDKSHMEQVERWAEFVRSNPKEVWKAKLSEFIDAQIMIARRFYRNLGKTKEGRVILKRLREERKNR